MLSFDDFKKSLNDNDPPNELSQALKALWFDAQDQWDMAHQTAQDDSSKNGSWVHAYLHRKEGDEFNAGYWYNRASQPKFDGSLTEEWESIVKTLLNQS